VASCDIVIVNWNSGGQLAEAIASICRHDHNCVSSVIVVDNASTDDSLARVQAMTTIPVSLQIIRNSENRGFGAACNQGAAIAGSEYLLFLNPDVCLFKDSLSKAIEFMQNPENTRVGIIGVQLVDGHGYVARSCSRFPTLMIFLLQSVGLNRLPCLQHFSQSLIEWDHGSTKQVDQVIGAFFLVRLELFLSLEGFDERFYVYFEEVDFSFRAHKQGWSSVFLAGAKAFHAGGGTSHQVKAHRLFYVLRSRLLYGFKHFRRWQAWILVGLTLAVEPFSRSLFALFSGGISALRDTWRGYIMLYSDIPSILKKSGRS